MFATCAVDISELLPDVYWPRQIELCAGKHMVRPRYEVLDHNRRRIAHVNVERGDLLPDPELSKLGDILGKGYLLPAPIMPRAFWQTLVLPTPMALTSSSAVDRAMKHHARRDAGSGPVFETIPS